MSNVAGALIVLAVLAALSGCVADARGPEPSALGEVISDVSLTLYVRDASGAEEYYEVKRDGAFAFGGGMNARFQRTTWTTQLTAQEKALRDLMVDNGWFSKAVRSTKTPPDARYTIDAKSSAGRLHKRIEGENDRVEPVRLWLRDIANRRLEIDLERQPRPSSERQPPGATQPTTQP
jgi:hypothetical protein